MSAAKHYSMMARYNVWATKRLLQSVDELEEVSYRKDCGLFFKSIHGTLNHLLVGEHMLWYPRFALGISPKLGLGDEVEADRANLKQKLLQAVERWQPLIETFSKEHYGGQLNYTSSKGVALSLPFAATLAHVFNHGTHHRGQITATLTAMGHTCPEIDLVYMLLEESSK